jgi:hypothetical protein
LETVEDDEGYWREIAAIKEIKRAVKNAATHEELIRLPYWS